MRVVSRFCNFAKPAFLFAQLQSQENAGAGLIRNQTRTLILEGEAEPSVNKYLFLFWHAFPKK